MEESLYSPYVMDFKQSDKPIGQLGLMPYSELPKRGDMIDLGKHNYIVEHYIYQPLGPEKEIALTGIRVRCNNPDW